MHNLRRMFAAVALALVVAPLIASAPLFDPDEGLHAAIAQEMVRSGDYVTPTFLGEPFLDKPILFFWAEAASLRIFGDRELAVRVPPLLFGLAGMLAVALLARAMRGELTGLAAGIVYGTMLLPLGVSQVAVHDIGLIPFLGVACWCLLRGEQRPVPFALLAGAMLGLSILTKGLVGCVFATIFGACLAVQRPSRIPRLFLMLSIAGVVSLAIAAPWYVAMEHAHPGYLHYYFVERHLQGYLTATQRHAGRPSWYYVPIVAGGALPWTGYLLPAWRRLRSDAPIRIVAGWFAVGLIFLSIGESKLITYALPLFPALAIACAAGLVDALTAARTRALRAGFFLHAGAVALLPAAGVVALQWRFGQHAGALWIGTAFGAAAALWAMIRAWRSLDAGTALAWMGGASIASLIAIMLALPRAGAWMTSRDLASVFNGANALPPRVSIVDERIGSLIFYLSPALRAQLGRGQIVETSFPDAVLRARVDPADAVVVVRHNQLPRFNRLFPAPPVPDAHPGTFALFRVATLRDTLRAAR